MEEVLGWLMAAAWFGLFCWIMWRGLRGFVSEPRSHFQAIAARPAQTLLLSVMIGGLMVFLFWILAAQSPISIDHVRPLGVPLGLWGFGIAGLCLPFLKY